MIYSEVIFKSKEELADIEAVARSIGAYNQPVDPVYIGSRKSERNIYHYYRDVDGKYYYESERCLLFDRYVNYEKKGRRKR